MARGLRPDRELERWLVDDGQCWSSSSPHLAQGARKRSGRWRATRWRPWNVQDEDCAEPPLPALAPCGARALQRTHTSNAPWTVVERPTIAGRATGVRDGGTAMRTRCDAASSGRRSEPCAGGGGGGPGRARHSGRGGQRPRPPGGGRRGAATAVSAQETTPRGWGGPGSGSRRRSTEAASVLQLQLRELHSACYDAECRPCSSSRAGMRRQGRSDQARRGALDREANGVVVLLSPREEAPIIILAVRRVLPARRPPGVFEPSSTAGCWWSGWRA